MKLQLVKFFEVNRDAYTSGGSSPVPHMPLKNQYGQFRSRDWATFSLKQPKPLGGYFRYLVDHALIPCESVGGTWLDPRYAPYENIYGETLTLTNLPATAYLKYR